MRAIVGSKRGRPKKVTAANDNTLQDFGTQELQLKRATLAQGTDPATTAHPLDLLLARGLISAPAHRAGWRYAGLYRQIMGRTDVSYGRLYAGLCGVNERGEDGRAAKLDDDGDKLRLAQQRFRHAQALLRAEGPVVAGITERLAVYGAWPDWLLGPMTPTHRELNLLRRGLGRLAAAAGLHDKAANDNIPDNILGNASSQVMP